MPVPSDAYTPTRPPYKLMAPGERHGSVVTVERADSRRWVCDCDCGKRFIAVASHLRAGVTKSCGHWRAAPDPASYNAIHLRINRTRGRAATFSCVDCGAPAKAWAYNRSGICEVTAFRGGYKLVYSTDEGQYDPCCGPCHYRRDHPARLSSGGEG